MAQEVLDFETVRSLGAELPEVTASAGKLGTALKLKGAILACAAIDKSAEPGSLMVSIGFERRDALVAENPEAFYLTGHYAPYPVVLVRLAGVSRAEMRELLAEAWESMTASKAAA